jgi:hypothetical protein
MSEKKKHVDENSDALQSERFPYVCGELAKTGDIAEHVEHGYCEVVDTRVLQIVRLRKTDGTLVDLLICPHIRGRHEIGDEPTYASSLDALVERFARYEKLAAQIGKKQFRRWIEDALRASRENVDDSDEPVN